MGDALFFVHHTMHCGKRDIYFVYCIYNIYCLYRIYCVYKRIMGLYRIFLRHSFIKILLIDIAAWLNPSKLLLKV